MFILTFCELTQPSLDKILLLHSWEEASRAISHLENILAEKENCTLRASQFQMNQEEFASEKRKKRGKIVAAQILRRFTRRRGRDVDTA